MKCPVEDCLEEPKVGQLMCLAHWRRVPRILQMKVNATWRNVRRDSQAYRDAREEAIAAVNNKQTQGRLF